jgi:hypothetical protein
MHIIPSNICSALQPQGVIGSKVINHAGFMGVLKRAVGNHDFTQDRIPGQAYLPIPEAVPFVSSGVGRRTLNPEDYVLRVYRERVGAFLKREFAAPVTTCAAVVYTMEAYLADPDVTADEAKLMTAAAIMSNENVSSKDCYVLVTVLASSGEASKLSPHRFTANLAGGNKEALVWTADEIRAKAREIIGFENDWVTVADPLD